jgi:predicted Zn-dependent protease
MKPVSAFKRGVAKVRREWLAERYDRALAEVARLLEEWPDNPHLLVMWADLIQLQEREDGASLDDARTAYQRAAELENDSPAALIELSHFLFAIDDDAEAASKAFGKCVHLCKRLLVEALLGHAEALRELERHRDANAALAEAYWLQTHDRRNGGGVQTEQIRERLRELKQAQ